jgi:hypothetical protein
MTVEEIINVIKEDYMSCPNVSNHGSRVLCGTWYRHDDCERLRELILKLTGDVKYTFPKTERKLIK